MISKETKKFIALTLTVLMSITILTSCGGQKSPSSSADPQKTESQVLSKEEYVDKVKSSSNEISEISNKYSADMQSSDTNTAADATTAFVNEIRPIYEELAALNAPEEFSSQQGKIKKGCEASLEILDLSVELIELGRGDIQGKEEEIAEKVTQINSKMSELMDQAQDMTSAINEVVTAA